MDSERQRYKDEIHRKDSQITMLKAEIEKCHQVSNFTRAYI